jgi:hypothetical protein
MEIRMQNSKFQFKNSKSNFELLTSVVTFILLQVDRNVAVPSRKFVESDHDRVFVAACICWFCSFANYVKNKLEEDCSIASFQPWWLANITDVLPKLIPFTQKH